MTYKTSLTVRNVLIACWIAVPGTFLLGHALDGWQSFNIIQDTDSSDASNLLWLVSLATNFGVFIASLFYAPRQTLKRYVAPSLILIIGAALTRSMLVANLCGCALCLSMAWVIYSVAKQRMQTTTVPTTVGTRIEPTLNRSLNNLY